MKRKIITNNKEFYEAFSRLNYQPEAVVEVENYKGIQRILDNINAKDTVIECEKNHKVVKLKKVGRINYNVYFSRKIEPKVIVENILGEKDV